MIINLLLGALLLLDIAWIALGIAYFWRLFQNLAAQPGKNTPKQKGSGHNTSLNTSVSQEQTGNVRHLLVGRSKPFVSSSFSEVPAASSSENPDEKPDTFAEKNSSVTEGIGEAESTEEDNETQVDYTMEEPDKDAIIREELQIAEVVMPEILPSTILAREVVRITGWHKNDDTFDEENEAEVLDTLQSIQGTQLMDYIKEATLKQEKGHQKLLAAIRKAEEAEMTNEETISPEPDPAQENSDASGEADRPLSYYLYVYCFCSYCTVLEGWLKSKTINQYQSYDETEPSLTTSTRKRTVHLTT